MTHTFLGEVLVNEVITTAVREFTLPKAPAATDPQVQFVIVWSYHGELPSADTYVWRGSELYAWAGDSWKQLKDTEAYHPLDPDPNHKIIALFKKD